MRDHVETGSPSIGEHCVDQLAGVEHGGGGIAEDRHPAILARLPEGPSAGSPLLLHSFVQGIVELAAIAVGELAIAEERAPETEEEQDQEAGWKYRSRQPGEHRIESPNDWLLTCSLAFGLRLAASL